jgi:RNA polymerase sigma-70 factor (ECF subfamily)
MSPDEAMNQYARGDNQAFSRVYDTVAPRLETYLRRNVRNPSQVEDILQHTFMQMHHKRGTFKDGSQVLPWAFSIARNFMIDLKRKSGREIASDAHDDCTAGNAFLVQAIADGEQALEAGRLGARLAAVFRGCTEHQRNAFELTRADGVSQAEAAQILNTTVMGIKQCAHKVYEKLRAAVVELEPSRPLPFAEPIARSGNAPADSSSRPPHRRV